MFSSCVDYLLPLRTCLLPKRRGCLIARLLSKVIAREQNHVVYIDIANWVFPSLKEGWLGITLLSSSPLRSSFCLLFISYPQPPLLTVTANLMSLGEKNLLPGNLGWLCDKSRLPWKELRGEGESIHLARCESPMWCHLNHNLIPLALTVEEHLSTWREQNASKDEAYTRCNSMHRMYTIQAFRHIRWSPVAGKQVKFPLALEQDLLLPILIKVMRNLGLPLTRRHGRAYTMRLNYTLLCFPWMYFMQVESGFHAHMVPRLFLKSKPSSLPASHGGYCDG